MAARGQLQIVLWAQKLQNLKLEIIQCLLSHSPRYGDVQVIFLKLLLKFKRAMDKLHIFLWAQKLKKLKPVINHIVQSHYPASANVHVILLKF